jgi:KUP system potassium uptake protein
MGVVFGDIGTSPIYTLTIIFLLIPATMENVLGILSLVLWTLVVLVTVQYTWLAMQLGEKGEGGTIVLREILLPMVRTGRGAAITSLLSIVGISLLIGDGVITPAISILSAVEGLRLIPGAAGIGQGYLVWIAGFIAFGLFWFQSRGTERVAWAFGPVMLLWFVAIAASGLISLLQAPQVLGAVSPLVGIQFFFSHGIVGFLILSQVVLCATGGEALFADMGQLGRRPIVHAWVLVFVALILNYLGQGAYVLLHPDAHHILFEMVYSQSPLLYLPFLLLSVIATVIASQALISGLFSIVYQAINTRILPLLKIDFTSQVIRSQIYIGTVNWLLLFSVLFILHEFQYSERLAAAYGLAVMGTMLITGILMTTIFLKRAQYGRAAVAGAVTFIDLVFFSSTLFKMPAGGYWSLIIAAVPFSIIIIYIYGQRRLYSVMHPVDQQEFLERFRLVYATTRRIRGTALFFARDVQKIPSYISHTMFQDCILYEDNVLITIQIQDSAFGHGWQFQEELAPGLRVFQVRYGYMELIDLTQILREAGIWEKTILFGAEEIVSDNLVWKVFAVIKRLAPTFVQFYRLPAEKIHGVVTRYEI